MDKLLRLGWWHRREACQPLELSHPFEFDFEGRCTRAKIILTIEQKERKEGRNQSRCSTEQFVFLSLSHSLSLLRFFSSLSFRYFRKSCFFSLFSAPVIIFHIGLDERFGKNRNVESSLSGEWKICCPYWNRINVRKQPVKVSIPPLLSSYKILTNVPNPDWIEPSTARSSTESVYRIQTSIPLEKFIFESDEPIKDSRISRHFFESETPFCWIPTAEWKKKEREKENYPRIPSENDKLGHQTRAESSRSFRDRPKKRMARAEGWQAP